MVRYLFDGHEVENFRCEGERVLFNVGWREYIVCLDQCKDYWIG